MKAKTKKVTVWYDDRPGTDPGWVARCTEYDRHGQPILGRIAMDAPIEADSAEAARREAARYYRVPVDSVEGVSAMAGGGGGRLLPMR
jgi:hypothetical protein